MRARFVQFAVAVGLCILLIQLSSCGDPAITDLNYHPGDSLRLHTIDTFSTYLSTIPETSPLIASGSVVKRMMIGNITDDSRFGQTYAGFYTQLLLPTLGVRLDSTNAVNTLDSVILVLADTGLNGSTTTTASATVQVYELTQDMDQTATYYTHDAFSVRSQPIGTKVINTTNAISGYPIRVPLEIPYLGSKLFHMSNAVTTDNIQFTQFFKGIYVTSRGGWSGVQAIYYPNIRITLFYHNSTVADSFSLTTSDYAARVNHIDHIYSGADIQQAFNAGATNYSNKAYLQYGGGAKVNMLIPGLKSLMNKGDSIAINKAEIHIPIEDETVYNVPAHFNLYGYDNTGTSFLLPNDHLIKEYSSTGFLSYVQSYFHTDSTHGPPYHYYTVDITTYVQSLVNGTYSSSSFLIQPSGFVTNPVYSQLVDRAVLRNDANSSTYKTKVRVLYTKIK